MAGVDVDIKFAAGARVGGVRVRVELYSKPVPIAMNVMHKSGEFY